MLVKLAKLFVMSALTNDASMAYPLMTLSKVYIGGSAMTVSFKSRVEQAIGIAVVAGVFYLAGTFVLQSAEAAPPELECNGWYLMIPPTTNYKDYPATDWYERACFESAAECNAKANFVRTCEEGEMTSELQMAYGACPVGDDDCADQHQELRTNLIKANQFDDSRYANMVCVSAEDVKQNRSSWFRRPGIPRHDYDDEAYHEAALIHSCNGGPANPAFVSHRYDK